MKMRKLGSLILIMCAFGVSAHARGPKEKLSTPVFTDEGDINVPFKMAVGSGTAVPQSWPIFNDIGLGTSTLRGILVQNPSANYSLLISTWLLFTESDIYFFVNPGSASLSLANTQTLYFKYGSGASTETVRGTVIRQ